MVERQLRRRGIRDERVLEAMATVPRELFVPERYRRRAYADSRAADRPRPDDLPALGRGRDLPGAGAGGHERVLEIGTGSGYSAAVLAMLAAEVITRRADRGARRAARARLLAEVGVDNVEVIVGDGSAGLPDARPTTRSQSTPPRPRRRPACSSSSRRAAGS